MPLFYFHLHAPDESFLDSIGSEAPNLAAAHAMAVRLAGRVMAYGDFANLEPNLQRWTVQIVDAAEQPTITVIFPNHFAANREKLAPLGGALAVIDGLEHTLGGER